jgi:prepilin-type N-terminal cleavage/methylation domain-containing protein
MSHPTKRPHAGFTLIELLTVIAIIGILASIIIPTIGMVQNVAKRLKDSSNLHTVGVAALTYAQDQNGFLPDPLSSSAAQFSGGSPFFVWFGLLAKSGGITEPKYYFSELDQLLTDPNLPPSVLQSGSKTTLNPDFVATSPSVEVVGGIRNSDSPECPILYTRGLDENGEWLGAKATYPDDWGGAIMFVGGQVQSYKGGIENKLINLKGKNTNDLLECIPTTTSGHQRVYGKDSTIGTEGGTTPVGAGS